MLYLFDYRKKTEEEVVTEKFFTFFSASRILANEDEVNKNLMEFLKTVPAKKLATGLESGTTEDPFSLHFAPVVDGDFLPESISILRKKTPRKLCITGTCEFEGLLFSKSESA